MHDLGVEIAIVVGGGNIFRGVSESAGNMDRAAADYIGMLATVMNAVVLQDALEKIEHSDPRDVGHRYSAACRAVHPPAGVRHLEKKRVVIFAAGTGNPYFTTDSAAALRALEIEAEVIMKATKVDGIYTRRSGKGRDREKFRKDHFQEVLEKQLKVMDASAISLCMDNDLPIMVFNMRRSGNIVKAVCGDLSIGTLRRRTPRLKI